MLKRKVPPVIKEEFVKMHAGLCLKLGLFGIVRVYNPNSWITIPMTRIVGKINKNTKEIKENNHRGAERPCGWFL